MSYYPDYFLNGRSANDRVVLLEWLNYLEYEAALGRQEPAVRHVILSYNLSDSQLGYVPGPYYRPGRRDRYYSHLQMPWNYGNPGAGDGYMNPVNASGLPVRPRPDPNPPVRPPPRPTPPASTPRPQPRPNPPPRPTPGPKRQRGRQSRIPDYYPHSFTTNFNHQSETRASQVQDPSSQNPVPMPTGNTSQQPDDPQHRPAQNQDSEGSQTPTQKDYAANESGYQSEASSIRVSPAQDTGVQAPTSVPAGKDEHSPASAQPKPNQEPSTRRRPQGLSRRQQRADRKTLPDDISAGTLQVPSTDWHGAPATGGRSEGHAA